MAETAAVPETTAESAPAAEPKPEPTPEPVVFTTESAYTLFGVMNEGLLVKSEELEMESHIILQEGGTGTMFFDGDTVEITQWELNNETVSLTLSEGGEADAKLHDGILDLYGNGSMILYFAREDADISGYEFLTLEEVREIQSKKRMIMNLTMKRCKFI